MTVVDPCDILLAVVARAGIRAGIEPGNEGPCFAVVVRAVVVCDERVAELAVEKASVVVHLPETAVGRDSQPSEHLVRKKLVRSRRTDDAKTRIVRDLRAKALLLRLALLQPHEHYRGVNRSGAKIGVKIIVEKGLVVEIENVFRFDPFEKLGVNVDVASVLRHKAVSVFGFRVSGGGFGRIAVRPRPTVVGGFVPQSVAV